MTQSSSISSRAWANVKQYSASASASYSVHDGDAIAEIASSLASLRTLLSLEFSLGMKEPPKILVYQSCSGAERRNMNPKPHSCHQMSVRKRLLAILKSVVMVTVFLIPLNLAFDVFVQGRTDYGRIIFQSVTDTLLIALGSMVLVGLIFYAVKKLKHATDGM